MAANPVEDGLFVHENNSPPHPSVLNLFCLKGKTAVVTSAGAGIGYAVAQGLAEAGANVAMWYSTDTKCPYRAAEIAYKYGVQTKAYQLDIRNAQAVEQTLNQTIRDFNGRLDIFIANAGIPQYKGPMVDAHLAHYSTVIDINLNGTFNCAKAAATHWRRQKEEGTDLHGNILENFTYGSFIATASMSGHVVHFPQMQAAYNAAKTGVKHLCKSLAAEWVSFARANTVSPGNTATGISDFVSQTTRNILKDKISTGRDEELKGAYLYLASDAASYTTGADLVVDS